jgi:hypothetical protein
MEKAFANAKPEAKEVVAQVVSALQSQDYPKASLGMQTLSGVADLTKEQRLLAARASLSINERLQSAQAQGDEKAAEVLRFQHSTK